MGRRSFDAVNNALPDSSTAWRAVQRRDKSFDGRFVYAGNRLHDSIAWLSIGVDGTLTWAGEEWTRGDYPRSFTIDPSGRFLFSCNQRSDSIACFRVDAKSGRLTFTGQYTPVGSPAHLVFLG